MGYMSIHPRDQYNDFIEAIDYCHQDNQESHLLHPLFPQSDPT